MNFQENLRKYREKAGFPSAQKFAEYLQIPYTTYISYENTGREPKYEMLCRIATALGTTPNDLLGFAPAIDESFLYCSDMLESSGIDSTFDVELLPDGRVFVKSDNPALDCTFPNKSDFVQCFCNVERNMEYSQKYKILLYDTIVEILADRHNYEQAATNSVNHAIATLQSSITKATTPEERGKLKQALQNALSELESSE